MKIVISSDGKDLGSNIDATFHRCSFFLILDTEKNSLITLKNTTKDRPGEIGATIGQIVSNKGADVVLTSNIGPKAFKIFKQYGIKVYQAKGIVEVAVRRFTDGNLTVIKKPTIPR